MYVNVNDKKNNPITRRRLLKDAAIAGMAGAIAPLTGMASAGNEQPEPAKRGIIAAENEKPGTTDWQLTYVRSEKYRSAIIEGFCSHTSASAGETIDIYLSANPAATVSVHIYRMGYYSGKGGRHITTLGPFLVETQPTPAAGEHRLRECRWQTAVSLTIGADWVSGVYLGKLSCAEHRYESYIIFVVKDSRKADVLVQTSDTTWQAYNKWPENDSLYDSDPPQRSWNATTWVSYDRPYGWYPQVVDQALSQGSGEFLLWEFPFCFWLEQHGYDVTYCANADTHTNDAKLNRVKSFFSVGHDEYWSLEMYSNVREAIEAGLNVGFLCGDSVTAVIPLYQLNGEARPHRIVRRTGMFGGILEQDRKLFEKMSSGWGYDVLHENWEKHGPSQALMVGGRTTYPGNGTGDWVVSNDKHWIFEGTGMKNGDFIPGLVGWEFASDPPLQVPGIEILASGEVRRGDDSTSSYAATIYPGPKGNWVFNAATIFWSIGLSQPPGFNFPFTHLGRPHGPDERVQTITSNFLKRCGVRIPT
ncbi:MAG TPA: twin-arginine translocation signal domain-containing protein [Agriterribacter sp.]|nr:twin-arginine translocation signal domain-containing protein [Agriterribacter sp.]